MRRSRGLLMRLLGTRPLIGAEAQVSRDSLGEAYKDWLPARSTRVPTETPDYSAPHFFPPRRHPSGRAWDDRPHCHQYHRPGRHSLRLDFLQLTTIQDSVASPYDATRSLSLAGRSGGRRAVVHSAKGAPDEVRQEYFSTAQPVFGINSRLRAKPERLGSFCTLSGER